MYSRYSKIVLVWSIGFFALLVTLNNIMDYQSNYIYVIHVLEMDSTFPDNKLGWRAIDSSLIHRIVYSCIIFIEGVVAVLCLAGGWRLLISVGNVDEFNASKGLAIIGMTIGILLWFLVFIVIGGEWFLMWQSEQWNGTQAAFRITVIFGMILIYLNMPDREDHD